MKWRIIKVLNKLFNKGLNYKKQAANTDVDLLVRMMTKRLENKKTLESYVSKCLALDAYIDILNDPHSRELYSEEELILILEEIISSH